MGHIIQKNPTHADRFGQHISQRSIIITFMNRAETICDESTQVPELYRHHYCPYRQCPATLSHQQTKANSINYKNGKEKHTGHTAYYVQGKNDQISRVPKMQNVLTILKPINKMASKFRFHMVR